MGILAASLRLLIMGILSFLFFSVDANDNILSFAHRDLCAHRSTIEDYSLTSLGWFEFNQMQASPGKFQAISVGQVRDIRNKTITSQLAICQRWRINVADYVACNMELSCGNTLNVYSIILFTTSKINNFTNFIR